MGEEEGGQEDGDDYLLNEEKASDKAHGRYRTKNQVRQREWIGVQQRTRTAKPRESLAWLGEIAADQGP